MNSEQDFYSLLGVSSSASERELKSAYRRLARQYHPDNRETGDETRFKELGEAYEILSDPQKRRVYDQLGHSAFMARLRGEGGGAGNGEYFTDGSAFEQIFEAFFGGGVGAQPGGRRQRRGGHIQQSIELEFLEAAFGCQQQLSYQRLDSCGHCAGQGWEPGHPPERCPTCGGTGSVRQSVQTILGVVAQIVTCPRCEGRGELITHPCSACHGRGLKAQEHQQTVELPAGIDDGMQVVLRSAGHAGAQGGPRGDLYLEISVKPHEHFRRDELDIHSELPISFWQAVQGGKWSVATIHGQEEVKLSPATQPGAVIELRGRGIQTRRSRGNHYLQVQVKVPPVAELPKEWTEFSAVWQEFEQPAAESTAEAAADYNYPLDNSNDKKGGSMFGRLFGKDKDKQ